MPQSASAITSVAAQPAPSTPFPASSSAASGPSLPDQQAARRAGDVREHGERAEHVVGQEARIPEHARLDPRTLRGSSGRETSHAVAIVCAPRNSARYTTRHQLQPVPETRTRGPWRRAKPQEAGADLDRHGEQQQRLERRLLVGQT